MPLKLDLKSGEKMIINGAVIENVGPNGKILVHNQAAIMRDKEILTKEEAATPAARVYFSLQCAYMFELNRDDHLKSFRGFLKDYLEACPSAQNIGDEITAMIDAENYYRALRTSRKLIAHEVETMSAFQSGMDKLTSLADDARNEEATDTAL
jgi:flagellar protein FlbT